MGRPSHAERRRALARPVAARSRDAVAAFVIAASCVLASIAGVDVAATDAVAGEARYLARDQRSEWTGRAPLHVDVFDLDLANLATARVEAHVRVADLRSGNALRDFSARTTVLDAAEHPEVRFRLIEVVGSVDAQRGVEQPLELIGELTVRDVTRQVRAAAEVRIDDDEVHVAVRFDVSLDAFGLGAPRFLMLVVEDAVAIEVDASWRLDPDSTTTTR